VAENAKHTPGPWKIAERSRVVLDNAQLIRPVDDRNHEHGATAIVALGDANARLIAAAPELLEALRPFQELYKQAVSYRHDPGSTCEWRIAFDDLARVDAAIAKAEGR
jgi:hypothetical protein